MLTTTAPKYPIRTPQKCADTGLDVLFQVGQPSLKNVKISHFWPEMVISACKSSLKLALLAPCSCQQSTTRSSWTAYDVPLAHADHSRAIYFEHQALHLLWSAKCAQTGQIQQNRVKSIFWDLRNFNPRFLYQWVRYVYVNNNHPKVPH